MVGEKTKRIYPSNNQGQSKAKRVTITKKNACYCGVFLSTTSYTRDGYISRTVEKERPPVCDISLQSNLRTVHKVKGRRNLEFLSHYKKSEHIPHCSNDVP